ncbi:hypothetical protein ASPBRDRAFT_201695 [Aspergillus brasiliensis CBS 101740]|uniref:Berberine/berberine-like domain-containing protein n=1 Tax=Aspergillus brasiliensis (strain CBS 101740 / IMI 381727 / IBT 21946) TaxID=767769 RepID=A0A1L9U1L2_ASPBC|nr:hypothetical protein ASPBRDRAFT_201695 [Aspergillus brasiliensis CBS 101740]
MEKDPRSSHSVLMFDLIPYGKTIEVPVNAAACADRGEYYNVGLAFMLKSACYAGQKGNVHAYANFAGHEGGATQLFMDDLPRLQDLKRKYDPYNLFCKSHNLISHTETQY